MAVSGVALTVTFGVWDVTNGAWKTGDNGNLTLRLTADGTEATPANASSEIDATNAPGQYKITLTAGENTGTDMMLGGKSATSGCVVIPATWQNTAVAVSTPPTAAAVADAVWDEASTGHVDAGKAGAAIWTTVPAIATILSGITSLAAWLRGLARKDAMDATAKTELNTGGGAYNETTDSAEAIRDRGDAAWVTATGFETTGAAAAAVATLNDLTAQEVRDAAKLAPTAGDPAAGSIDAHLDAGALEATLTAIKGGTWSDETLVTIQAAAEAATAPTVEQIDTQLSSTHGSGSWGGAAGSGANTVTVTVQTSGGTVYSGVTVSINNQTETGTAYTVQTNSLGQAVFYLDTGSWRAIAAQSREQGGGATNFTVDGAEAVTVTVTALSVPAAASADNYLLYGYERKVEADSPFGAAGVTVKIIGVSPAAQTDATANACRRIMGTSYSTDANGLWSFEIAKTLAGSRLKLRFTWTDAGSTSQVEEWQAVVAASAANASDQIAWADLSPTKTR